MGRVDLLLGGGWVEPGGAVDLVERGGFAAAGRKPVGSWQKAVGGQKRSPAPCLITVS